ncbi:MAG: hypothetical protein M1826_006517 [Phylliscum demangeonii]|nr:MAG: hypothetical protein M1826_006517 [Phylliscum demangeonii]
MTRGNQRDKAREKTLKAQASSKAKNSVSAPPPATNLLSPRSSDTYNPPGVQQSGTAQQRTKEEQAAIMRAKQEQANAKKSEELRGGGTGTGTGTGTSTGTSTGTGTGTGTSTGSGAKTGTSSK